MLVSNIRENGKPIGTLPDGEMMFHHDTIYKPKPHIGTLLYAIEVPSKGGNTKFNNLYKAYDALPDDIKERVKGRTANHIYDYVTIASANRKSQAGDLRENYTHPVCITHPRSGRKALYVDRLMTARIDGIPEQESEEILETMFDIAELPEHVMKRVEVPDAARFAQVLQLGFDLLNHLWIEQLAKLFLAEQLAQQIPIE